MRKVKQKNKPKLLESELYEFNPTDPDVSFFLWLQNPACPSSLDEFSYRQCFKGLEDYYRSVKLNSSDMKDGFVFYLIEKRTYVYSSCIYLKLLAPEYGVCLVGLGPSFVSCIKKIS
jgi:hypothetical protein